MRDLLEPLTEGGIALRLRRVVEHLLEDRRVADEADAGLRAGDGGVEQFAGQERSRLFRFMSMDGPWYIGTMTAGYSEPWDLWIVIA